MKREVAHIDFGLVDYQEAWDKQRVLFSQLLNQKATPSEENLGYFVLCEHPHVYTLGKSGADANLLVSDKFLHEIGASYHKTDRGGDITYHGPGQIVGYPIINLEKFEVSLKEYIHKIEELIILTIAEYGIIGERLDGATGVWLDPCIPGKARKICAIGVKASRFITMHGFALNVNTNLDYFSYINPCGFLDKGVTSMEKELGRKLDFEEVKKVTTKKFETVFNANLYNSAEVK
jgi:lipoyl(octanoyl) transferase